jgi:excisionase family DNA binding protein
MTAWLSPTDVASELNVSRDSVLRAIKRGDLPAMTYGRLVRVSRDDLTAFIATHRTAPPTRRRLRSSA